MFNVKKMSKSKFYFQQSLGTIIAMLTFVGFYLILTQKMQLDSNSSFAFIFICFLVTVPALVLGTQIAYKKQFPNDIKGELFPEVKIGWAKVYFKSQVLIVVIISSMYGYFYIFREYNLFKAIISILVFGVSYYYYNKSLKELIIKLELHK